MFKFGVAVAGLLCALPAAGFANTAPIASPPLYCEATGGVVQTRIPTYGTNGGTPLPLSGARQFCEYVSKDRLSHIDVLLSTLVTVKPSLAALAYYARVKFNGATCHGSPGSCYCSQIGGTDLFGGINAAGGGWVLSTDSTDALDVCIFPDMSAIDAYGLFYHSDNIIRGRNLDHRLRYANPY